MTKLISQFKKKTSKYNWLLLLLLYILLALFIYKNGIVDTTRQDHFPYMHERVAFESDWDWFVHSISYSRTRFTNKGDYYLFRPGHMAVLAVSDIFWRDNPVIRGAIGFIILGMAAFSLHRVLSLILGSSIAFLFTMVFMTNYAGMEMVVWRHITPYLLSLSFFFFGLREILIIKQFSNFSIHYKIVIYIFIATLFHESIAFSLILLILILMVAYLWHLKKYRDQSLFLALIINLLLPLVLFFTLNIADFLYYQAPDILGTTDRTGDISFIKIVNSIWLPLAAASNVFLFPFTKTLNFLGGFNVWMFDPNTFWFNCFGAIVFAILLFLFFQNSWKLFFCNFTVVTIVELGIIFNLIAIISSIGIGRVLLRSILYLYKATYYYSMTTFLLCAIFAFFISRVYQYNWFPRWKILNQGIISIFCLTLILQNYSKLSIALSSNASKDFIWAYWQTNLSRSLKKNNQFCLRGIEPSSQEKILSVISTLLFTPKYYCRTQDARKNAYLQLYQNNVWLSKMTIENTESPMQSNTEKVDFNLSNPHFIQKNDRITSINPVKNLEEGKGFVLSKNSYKNPELSLTFHHHTLGGIVVGYKDKENFILFVIQQFSVYAHVMKNGKLSNPIGDLPIPFSSGTSSIQIKKVGNYLTLFLNDYLLTAIPDIDDWEGRVGLFSEVNGKYPQEFSNFIVLGKNQISFIPIVNVSNF
ncbi:MAG: hypothetical protein KDK90_05750 [Leptospiraceae bacterium]|nr:hypothetical protein [Leptospiraceae bacterium]